MSSDAEPTKPRFTQPLQDREVLEGNRARLDCVIVAHPEPEVRHSRSSSEAVFARSVLQSVINNA